MSTDTKAPEVMMQDLLETMNMTLPELRSFVDAAVDVVIAYDTGMSVQTLVKRIEAMREML